MNVSVSKNVLNVTIGETSLKLLTSAVVNIGGSSVQWGDITGTLSDQTDLQDALDLKLDAADYNDRFLGLYASLFGLQAAHPTASAGDYAQVDLGIGTDVIVYAWDVNDAKWAAVGSSAIANTDALPEGSTNLYHTSQRVRDTTLTGFSASNTPITATDSIVQAFGKAQGQIDAKPKTLTASVEPFELLGGTTAPTSIPQFVTFTPDTDGTYILTIDFLMGAKSGSQGIYPQFFINSSLVAGGTSYASTAMIQSLQSQVEFRIVKSAQTYRVYAWCRSHPIGTTQTMADAALTITTTQAGSPLLGFNMRPVGVVTISSLIVQNVTLTKL